MIFTNLVRTSIGGVGGSVGLAEKSDLVERLRQKRDEAAAKAKAKESVGER